MFYKSTVIPTLRWDVINGRSLVHFNLRQIQAIFIILSSDNSRFLVCTIKHVIVSNKIIAESVLYAHDCLHNFITHNRRAHN